MIPKQFFSFSSSNNGWFNQLTECFSFTSEILWFLLKNTYIGSFSPSLHLSQERSLFQYTRSWCAVFHHVCCYTSPLALLWKGDYNAEALAEVLCSVLTHVMCYRAKEGSPASNARLSGTSGMYLGKLWKCLYMCPEPRGDLPLLQPCPRMWSSPLPPPPLWPSLCHSWA